MTSKNVRDYITQHQNHSICMIYDLLTSLHNTHSLLVNLHQIDVLFFTSRDWYFPHSCCIIINLYKHWRHSQSIPLTGVNVLFVIFFQDIWNGYKFLMEHTTQSLLNNLLFSFVPLLLPLLLVLPVFLMLLILLVLPQSWAGSISASIRTVGCSRQCGVNPGSQIGDSTIGTRFIGLGIYYW